MKDLKTWLYMFLSNPFNEMILLVILFSLGFVALEY
jgi:hypothetical protein